MSNKAKLKEGVVLRPNGPSSELTNDHLTDEVATYLLEAGRAQESDFEVLPAGYGKAEAAKKSNADTTKAKTLTLPQAKGALTIATKKLTAAKTALEGATDENREALTKDVTDATAEVEAAQKTVDGLTPKK